MVSTKDMPGEGPQEAYREGWTDASAWGSADRMNDLEALMWRSERHPQQSSTVSMLMILDETPDWDRLRDAHDWASEVVPLMRKRVVEPALPLGPPVWVPDSSFNLDYHLRRVHLPAAGGQSELLAFAQSAALAPFDRARPLWEATLIDGLADGKAAYLLKLHHSLTDGRGVIQLLSLVQSPTRDHTPKDPVTESDRASRSKDPFVLAMEQLGDRLASVPTSVLRRVSADARALTNPRGTLDAALRYAASMRRTLSPGAASSPLFHGRAGTDWRFGVMECEFADLRAAAKAASGSVNDAYIAALLGGLRRYHDAFGVELDSIPMAMPVSVRKADDPMGGNKFAGAMFAAPLAVVDPAERIAAVRGIVLSLRVEPAIDSFSTVAPALNLMPSSVGAKVLRFGASADISASNVPGIARPTYLAGSLVERAYGFGPLPSVAVMATMVSHSGVACFGFNCDGAAVTDVPLFVDCMKKGLAEVLSLAPKATRTRAARKSPEVR